MGELILTLKNRRSHSSGFFSGVLVLSISTLVVKVIGLAYKIPMLSLLGAEGMGYFNSAYEIYALLCVISTAGLPTALSMLISSYKERNLYGNVRRVYKNALSVFLAFGIFGTALLIGLAPVISDIIENENVVYCIVAIAPALLCVCLSSAIRGYFQGFGNMLPTALSQLIEAVLKLVLGIAAAIFAINQGFSIPIVSAFAVAGLTLGTFVSAVYLLVLKHRKRSADNSTSADDEHTMKTLVRIAFPITLSSAVLSVTRIVDMSLIMRRLQDIGYTSGSANEIYGAYSTVAVPIFSLLPSLLTPISLSLIPALSGAIERRVEGAQREVIESAIRLTVIFAIPSSFAIMLYSNPIISLLFSNTDEALDNIPMLLSILALSIPFSCMITTTNAILQAYRKTALPIVSMSVGALIKIVLAYILIGIPAINVYGAPISTFFCDALITIINLRNIGKTVKVKSNAFKLYVKPLLASVVAMLGSFALYLPMALRTEKLELSFLISAPVAVIVYFGVSFLIGSITKEDVLMLPMGGKIIKIISPEKRISRINK